MADVTEISIERDRSVTVVFDDGVTLELPVLELRQSCPCAGCRGQREHGRDPWTPRPGKDQPSILDAELVGAWGISIRWDDGHDTGIYAWEYLRRSA
jgi:DUF971 family protein